MTIETALDNLLDFVLANRHTDNEFVRCWTYGTEIPKVIIDAEQVLTGSKQMIPIQEVNIMSLSAQALKLATRYIAIVNQYEDPDGFSSSGYTAQEQELRRTRAHNDLIAQLKSEGVDVSDRAATTELALLMERWRRDE